MSAEGTPGRAQRWWGWGEDARVPAHLDAQVAAVRGELGLPDGASQRPVALAEARMSDPALGARASAGLAEIVGAAAIADDRITRARHAAGKGYVDLVRQRAGAMEDAPDAVVSPADHAQVHAVLDLCAREGIAVVPFGGGTSVVGGVAPLRGRFGVVVSLDLGRLDRLVAVDEPSLTAVVEPGMRCPEAERALGARGLTLGHFPQSFEYATLGGCAATRSAGQASTGYGRIDELVLGLRLAAPGGELDLPAGPASAAGPDLRELVVGSEGVLGVITRLALSVRPRPAVSRYEGWFFASFEAGVETLRELEQSGAAPDVARLSDEEETRASMLLAAAGREPSAARRLGSLYLRARGRAGGCLAITGWEGDRDDVARRRARSAALLRRGGAVGVGRRAGDAWSSGRFSAPYLRDALLDHSIMVETLETATSWSRLLDLHRAVRGALELTLAGRGTPGRVLCHVSHLYPSGASLYFTFLAPQQRGAEEEQWQAAKDAASEAIVAAGATITHHHAVGRDHARWLPAEVGADGIGLIAAAKERLDPAGVMNPGKVLAG